MRNTVGEEKIRANKALLEIRLPDTRGVSISRWGAGNLKIGLGVLTYSKLAETTCPGATPGCKQWCYAKRISGPVFDVYYVNTQAGADVPPLPADAKLVRMHVSGDFDSVAYIRRWIEIVSGRPDVKFWAYTRSWRIPEFLPHLEELRALPNIQVLASMDDSVDDLPPEGWRRSWLDGDLRLLTITSRKLVCPEEQKKVANCEACGYCFKSIPGDVVFLKH